MVAEEGTIEGEDGQMRMECLVGLEMRRLNEARGNEQLGKLGLK